MTKRRHVKFIFQKLRQNSVPVQNIMNQKNAWRSMTRNNIMNKFDDTDAKGTLMPVSLC